MTTAQIISVLIGGLGGAGALLAYFKFKPGQREQVGVEVAAAQINVAQGSLSIAHGSIALVSETYEKEFKRLNAGIELLRAEHASYRADVQLQLDELGVRLRAEKAEKERVERENEALRHRVDELEVEVARLKAAGGKAP